MLVYLYEEDISGDLVILVVCDLEKDDWNPFEGKEYFESPFLASISEEKVVT